MLRIEDTDVARSTQEAVDQILAAMHWLGLDYDEGPFYQMQRSTRYREVIAQMLAAGTGLPLLLQRRGTRRDARGAARARREDALRRHAGAPSPARCCRRCRRACRRWSAFATRSDGEVTWDDLVKGPITISNHEIDDLIIAAPDGTPTYNFCVVVDDWDMRDHARDPRRRPRQQHAVADQHLPRARRRRCRSTATCR